MIKKLSSAALILCLTACASTNYTEYAIAQVKISEANALAQKYRYDALAALAKEGSDIAKVATVMSLSQQSTQVQRSVLEKPKTWQDSALQWASVLVPGLTQAYSISANKQIALGAQQASVTTSGQQMSSFVELGKLINDPTVVTQPAPVVVTQPAPVVVKPEVVQTQVVQPQVVQVR